MTKILISSKTVKLPFQTEIINIFIFIFFQAASPRWEPQVSVLCEAGQSYHPQYLSEDGRWTTDLSIKTPGTTCLRDKMDLLDYCKKVSAVAKKKIIHSRNPISFFFTQISCDNLIYRSLYKIHTNCETVTIISSACEVSAVV
jgi:hypothetical protein